MLTSSWFTPLPDGHIRVGISRSVPRRGLRPGFRMYRKLAPGPWFNSVEAATYRRLYQAEQQLLLSNGLPLRPWYKHVLYAPGYYTGYSVKTLPGIRESIEQRNFKEAETGINQAANAINKLSEYLELF